MDQKPAPKAPDAGEAIAKAPPCTLVIFGAGGDLTKRLLMPALYNLAMGGLLDETVRIIGVDHNANTDEGWRKSLSDTMQSFTTDRTSEFHPDHIDPKAWGFVRERLTFRQGDFTAPETFSGLGKDLSGNVLHDASGTGPPRALQCGGATPHLSREGLFAPHSPPPRRSTL